MGKGRRDHEVCPGRWPWSGCLIVIQPPVYYARCCHRIIPKKKRAYLGIRLYATRTVSCKEAPVGGSRLG